MPPAAWSKPGARWGGLGNLGAGAKPAGSWMRCFQPWWRRAERFLASLQRGLSPQQALCSRTKGAGNEPSAAGSQENRLFAEKGISKRKGCFFITPNTLEMAG